LSAATWPLPEPGDIVWCRFPQRPRDKPGPKPRPALVLKVVQREDGHEVVVAYGTSQGVSRLVAGQFAIRKQDSAAAYAQVGLSYDTKFDFHQTVALPWESTFFDVPPVPRHGSTPKLGSLHASLVKAAQAAFRSASRDPS
jgi:mRNA-degrading endonuclease toxin of MazEF toxin-antitoxin module